jgi:hypothetical protein
MSTAALLQASVALYKYVPRLVSKADERLYYQAWLLRYGVLLVHQQLAKLLQIPEDLYMLIKKAVAVRKHLQINRKDKDGKL